MRTNFNNTKVHVKSEDESRRVQERLFEVGYKWLNGVKEITHLDMSYLFIDEKHITYANDNDNEYFKQHANELVTVEDILGTSKEVLDFTMCSTIQDVRLLVQHYLSKGLSRDKFEILLSDELLNTAFGTNNYLNKTTHKIEDITSFENIIINHSNRKQPKTLWDKRKTNNSASCELDAYNDKVYFSKEDVREAVKELIFNFENPDNAHKQFKYICIKVFGEKLVEENK